MHLPLSYLRSKHPLRLLLIDLVNLDFVRLVFLLGCVYLLCYFLVHSGILVPDALAALLAVLSPLLGKLVLLYLAASSMIQYLHLKWRTASPFEVILDEHMAAGIRLLTALVAVGVTAVRLKNDPNLLENLLDPSRATYSTLSFKHSSDVTYYTLGSLLALTASATVVFRSLAHRQKREILKVVAKYQVAKEDLELKLEEEEEGPVQNCAIPQLPSTLVRGYRLVALFCALAALFGILTAVSDKDPAGAVRLFLAVPVVCVFTPFCFVMSEKKMVDHLRKKGREARRAVKMCKASVAPQD